MSHTREKISWWYATLTCTTEVDLFSFDAPAPAPATSTGNDSFGDFQSTPAPAPAADDFAAFGELRAAGSSSGPDPFAAAPAPAPQPAASFDAFGPSNTAAGGMATMNNAFGNMNMGGGMQQQSFAPAPEAADEDEFGDFGSAPAPAAAVNVNPADPMSKLVSLDGLSKNVNKNSKLKQTVAFNDAIVYH